MPSTITTFTPGDLVISLYGDASGGGAYGDNQASPITLEELTTSGTVVGQLVLPQASSTSNGVTESVISGEYGSSSEGILQLSADGQSLTIAGYGINATTYNAAEIGFTKTTGPYGSNALAQTTSLSSAHNAVPRVIADIRANGTIDTSTTLYNVDDTNNPRSVVTANGSSFYLSGQGVKGDTTQGLQSAADGASSATIVNASDDSRIVEIYNGQLYVSQDSKQPSSGGTSNIATVGTGLPTGPANEVPLTGISQTVALNGTNGNGINTSAGTVHLSPESYFFANATTLYVADGGNPKQGGLGDGGLQKWSLVSGSWQLDYTLSTGLNLKADTTADPGSGGAGTTGLIGLTGVVTGNTVQLYATNATVGDLNQTDLYGISDALAATTATAASNESFTTLFTAPQHSNVRGIAFAPVAPSPAIANTHASTDAAEAAVQPFAGPNVAVTDPNAGATDTLTIALTGGGGTLAEGAGYAGSRTLTQTGAGTQGTYTLSGTAAQITTELDALTFVPANTSPGATVATTFSLTDSSNAGSLSATDSGTVVTDTAAAAATSGGGGGAGSVGPSVSSSSGPDLLAGTAGSDTVSGQAGDDTIVGGGGNDLVLGNQGDDSISDGDGNSTIAGGMGDDRITVGNGSNLLYGNEGSDTIQAGNGGDTIVGGQDSTDGADLITSGSGNDLILGNGGDDTVAAGGGADTVVGGFGRDLILGNQGNDLLLGNQGDDTLYGGQGGDTLVGGMGNDVLSGNEGDDVLYGNEGLNTFVFAPGDTDFKSGVSTGDTVVDFATGSSRIDFASGPAGTASNFAAAQTTSTDFAQIQALAQTLLTGSVSYAFVADGVDGFLFTTGGTGTAITDAVKLTGAGSAGAVKATDIAHGALA